ncbi:MAG: energy transducer TonB [Bacteroidia bacterium]
MKPYLFLLFFLFVSGLSLAQDTTKHVLVVRRPTRLIDTNAVVLPALFEPDQPAEFPGGKYELARYLHEHVVYPEKAKTDSVQGSVILRMTISAAGKVGKIKVVKSLGSGCDEAAIHMASKMPAWIGAMHKGKHIESEVYLPIVFLIQ